MPPGVKWDQKFQSTHPVRGATARSQQMPNNPMHFNPRTPCGVRLHAKLQRILVAVNFNPRTPCGVRRTVQLDHTKLSSISIHAPRAGCDIQRKANHARTSDFNPRTPCGVRLEKLRINFNAVLFQSTHPVRGATQSLFRYKGDLTIFQSTHPVRGATSARGLPMLLVLNFNPRTPCGVRRPKFNYEVRHKNISIHAPRAGCDKD